MSQQINLFNPIFLKQKKYFSTLAMLQALGLILLGSLAFYGFAAYQVSALSKQTAEISKRVDTEQARLGRVMTQFAPRQKDPQVEAQIKQLEAQLKVRQEVMATLQGGALGNTKGYSDYMRAFARQNLEGLWLTGFSIAGAEMTISGRALRPELLPNYIQRLSQEPALRGRTFAFLEMHLPAPQPASKERAALPPNYIEFDLRSTPQEQTK